MLFLYQLDKKRSSFLQYLGAILYLYSYVFHVNSSWRDKELEPQATWLGIFLSFLLGTQKHTGSKKKVAFVFP